MCNYSSQRSFDNRTGKKYKYSKKEVNLIYLLRKVENCVFVSTRDPLST